MRQEKQLLLEEIKGQFNKFGSFVVMRYLGLNANTANDFRRDIAKQGGDVEIMRKRVLAKAAKEAGIELDLAMLTGHVGIVFIGKDPIETAKTVFKYSRDTNKAISVIGGRFDGRLYGAEDVEKLSKLPGKDEMRAQILGVLEAPMAQTLAVIEAVLSSVVYCLDNKCKQSEEGL